MRAHYDREAREHERISVCVCTFRRPKLLGQLLESMRSQAVESCSVDVVVVDNDEERSAHETVLRFAAGTGIATTYYCEPQRSISLARNRAVREATGGLVAFIDDDERPSERWLTELYRTLNDFGADGVLGPVLPEFPAGAPLWLRKGRFLDRRRLRTGTRIAEGDCRTGNVLLRRSVFGEGECWFDPELGRTGGEDSDFFRRQVGSGRVFVWCDEAVVHETVTPDRWTCSFQLRKLWRAGTLEGEWMREGRVPSRGVLAWNLVVLVGCVTVALPSLCLPKYMWMRVLRKVAYCCGLITAYVGLSLLRYRD
jgi:succinoglycan biosynthesis protein ExoM